MTYLDSILLGVVEGLTEFLPVSSTGHLILASEFLGIPDSTFLSSYTIAIQLGAILAVVVLHWRSFLDLAVVKRIIAAFIPTAAIGLLVYSFAKEHLLGNVEVVLWALLLGGIALIIFELLHKEKESAAKGLEDITYVQAALVGVCQALAIIPGVSRSAATILGGLMLGISRVAIVQFSFLLAVPVMASATALDLYKSAGTFATSDFSLLAVGFITSFVVAMLAMKLLLAFVRTHSFISFGIYRILLALVFFLVIL